MTVVEIIKPLWKVMQWLCLILISFIALNRYSPLLLKHYTLTLVLAVCIPIVILLLQRRVNLLSSFALFVLLAGLSREGYFHYQRYQVLNSNPETLQLLGQHIIVGYRDLAEVKALLDQQLVNGSFITNRNVKGLSLAELQQLTDTLTDSPALWLATDQEGGLVQRLSPPLPRQAALQQVIKHAEAAWPEAVQRYAHQQGQHLASVGVNLNLSPVLDLPPQGAFWDSTSYIKQRVLAEDLATLSEAGRLYSSALLKTGVLPCLKHFPGLGRVSTDTHFFPATIDADLAELAATDWQPFKHVSQQVATALMLAHVQIAALDPEHPASFSPAVIRFLREQWAFDGLLITDDFSMFPVYYSDLGSGQAAVQALNSGVDLILISYDDRLFYPVMYALLQAYERGELSLAQLAASRQRQQRIHRLLFAINALPNA